MKKFKYRGFATLLLTAFWLWMCVSGFMCYIAPRGRDAHWAGWNIMGLDKDGWGSVHIISSFLFIGIGIWHLWFNWAIMKAHMIKGGKKAMVHKRELGAAFGISTLVMMLTIMQFQPLQAVSDFSEKLKDDYAQTIDRSPWAHAEEFSLATLGRKLGISSERIMQIAEKTGYKVDLYDRLDEIAKEYDTTPMAIFAMIRGELGDEYRLPDKKAATKCGGGPRKQKI